MVQYHQHIRTGDFQTSTGSVERLGQFSAPPIETQGLKSTTYQFVAQISNITIEVRQYFHTVSNTNMKIENFTYVAVCSCSVKAKNSHDEIVV